MQLLLDIPTYGQKAHTVLQLAEQASKFWFWAQPGLEIIRKPTIIGNKMFFKKKITKYYVLITTI